MRALIHGSKLPTRMLTFKEVTLNLAYPPVLLIEEPWIDHK